MIAPHHQSSAEELSFFTNLSAKEQLEFGKWMLKLLDDLAAHDRIKAQELLARIEAEGPGDLDTSFVHVSHFVHEPSCIPELERVAGALAHNANNTQWRTLLAKLKKEYSDGKDG